MDLTLFAAAKDTTPYVLAHLDLKEYLNLNKVALEFQIHALIMNNAYLDKNACTTFACKSARPILSAL